ncbi:MAG: TetR/AcrR family transcriptional regulator [Anaerolineales bacterium]
MPKVIEDEQIFQAVLKSVSERGYAGATTKQMAEAAGVSEVTLFRKYENKAQLVSQAIAYIIEQTDFAASARYTGDIHADLLRVVQAYQDTAVKYGLFIFALFADLARFPELLGVMDKPLRIFQSIGALIARYQRKGILKPEHPLHAVASLLGPLMYIITIRREKLDSSVPPMDLPAHVTCFLEGRRI